jgi:hypothetical protein
VLDVVRTELKFSVRGLARSPVFTLVAILSLALGIGVTTAVFSVVHALQFRPLPYDDATRLVDISEHHPTQVCAGCGVGTSYATYLDVRRTARTLDGTAAYRSASVALATAAGAERRRAALLTGIGVVFGSVGAFGLGQVLRSQFFNARAVGLPDIALLVLAFFAVATLASWVPARRAARTDPMATLRAD